MSKDKSVLPDRFEEDPIDFSIKPDQETGRLLPNDEGKSLPYRYNQGRWSVHLDFLKNEYEGEWTGGKYNELCKTILAYNTFNATQAAAKVQARHYKAANAKLKPGATQLQVEEIGAFLGPHSRVIASVKAATRGDLITDNLRKKIGKDLRETVAQHFSEGPLSQLRGKGTQGRINKALVTKLEAKLNETFSAYAKKNYQQTPSNVRSIAETELRTAIDGVKNAYMLRMSQKNPTLVIMKKWVHRRPFGKEDRIGHMTIHNSKVHIDMPFEVPQIEVRGGIRMTTGSVFMLHPHDPDAPPGETINCRCQVDYIAIVPEK